MRSWINGALVVLTLMGGTAAGAAAECARYVTSGPGDEPFSGELLGQKTVTIHFSGSGFGYTASFTETYTIGSYRMADGSKMDLNCYDYTPYNPLPV
jgi:hypothetical protein